MKHTEHACTRSLTCAPNGTRFLLKHEHDLLALLGALVLSGCGGGAGGSATSADTQIVISPSSVLLTGAGQTKQLTAVVETTDGTPDPLAQVTWRIVDPTAASVNASGNTATGIGRTITAPLNNNSLCKKEERGEEHVLFYNLRIFPMEA